MWNPTITKSLWLLSRSEHSSSVGFEQFEWQEYAINLCARFLLFRKYKNCYQWLTCIMPKLLQIQTQTPALSIMFAFSWHLPSLSSKQQNIKVQPNHKAIGNECVLTNTDLLWLLSRCAYSGNFGFWAIWVTRVVPSISVWFCCLGSMKIVGNDLHVAMSKLLRIHITNPMALYHVALCFRSFTWTCFLSINTWKFSLIHKVMGIEPTIFNLLIAVTT